jgi:hypothetical protein
VPCHQHSRGVDSGRQSAVGTLRELAALLACVTTMQLLQHIVMGILRRNPPCCIPLCVCIPQALPVGEFLALEHGTEYAGYVAHAEADSPSHIESSAGECSACHALLLVVCWSPASKHCAELSEACERHK